MSNLDAKLRADAREDLLELHRRVGTTTIYVTHDQVEAMGMGDRIAVMNAGKLRQLGLLQEIYDDPADTFVAGFLGSPPMNLFDEGGGAGPWGFARRACFRRRFIPGGKTRFAFRSGWTRVESLGADRLLYGSLGGHFQDQKAVAKLPSTVSLSFRTGESHVFAVAREDLRFFDKTTGLRTEPQPL